MAQVTRANGEVLQIRGQTEANGQYRLFLPQGATLKLVTFYDPLTNRFGTVYPRIHPSAPFRLPRFYMVPVDQSTPDFDQDGLVDIAELVYGTQTNQADTDSDGITDFAEIQQGLDRSTTVVFRRCHCVMPSA
jgi:hypothetical protein